jgi:hypothetical protein
MRTPECKRTAIIAALVCCALAGLNAVLKGQYFLTFLILAIANYGIVAFPAILYRYKIRKYPTPSSWGEAAVVVVIIEIVCMSINTVVNTLCGVQDNPFVGMLWLLLDWWILRHNEHIITTDDSSEEAEEQNGDLLWAETMRCLPFGMKWKKIKNTDFGTKLKKVYLDNISKQANTNKLAYCITLSTLLAVLEERAKATDIREFPQNYALWEHADRMIKKMYKKRYINDTTQQSLSARVDKCRRTLRNKM